MKEFKIERSLLTEALKRLSHAVTSRPILPAISNLLVEVSKEAIEFTATDMELTISYTIPAENKREFSVLLPFADLKHIAAVTNGLLTVQIEEKVIKLLHGDDVFNLGKEEKVADFPKKPTTPVRNVVNLPSDKAFTDSFAKAVASAASGDKDAGTVPALASVCLEIKDDKLQMVSSDKFTMYVKEITLPAKVEEALTFLVDPKIAKAIEGLVDMQLSYTKENICFKGGAVTVICRGKDLKYPEWRRIIPNDKPTNFIIQKDALQIAVEKCLIAENENNRVDLEFKEGKVYLQAIDTGKEKSVATSLSCVHEYNGGISLRLDHILRTLKQLEAPGLPHDCELQFSIASPTTLVSLSIKEDPKLQLYLMPFANPQKS